VGSRNKLQIGMTRSGPTARARGPTRVEKAIYRAAEEAWCYPDWTEERIKREVSKVYREIEGDMDGYVPPEARGAPEPTSEEIDDE